MRRVQGGGRPPGREQRLLDVYNERPVRLSAKVSIPVREHPKVEPFTVSGHLELNWTSFSPVQLCGQVAWSQGELVEAAAGGHDDQDGGSRARLDEEQTAGGGAEELDRPKAQPPEGGAARRDHRLRLPCRGPRQARLRLDRGEIRVKEFSLGLDVVGAEVSDP